MPTCSVTTKFEKVRKVSPFAQKITCCLCECTILGASTSTATKEDGTYLLPTLLGQLSSESACNDKVGPSLYIHGHYGGMLSGAGGLLVVGYGNTTVNQNMVQVDIGTVLIRARKGLGNGQWGNWKTILTF